MESPATFGLLVAFSAGLLSFLSPCVLPLVPSYVTFITGLSLEEVRTSRRTVLIHALLFVLGFSAVFVSSGALFGYAGTNLRAHTVVVDRILGRVTIARGKSSRGLVPGLQRGGRVHRGTGGGRDGGVRRGGGGDTGQRGAHGYGLLEAAG